MARHFSRFTLRAGAIAWPDWASWLLVAALALLPRVLGLADFYTIDEGYHWPGRVEAFSAAIGAGDWAGTNLTGHPGVTTMWLGSAGRWLALRLGINDPGWAGGGATYLGMLRLPLALANGLAVVAGYALLRRLLVPSAALLAALLWACDPVVIAYSRLLHVEGLLTSLLTLTMLALLAAFATAPGGAHCGLVLLSGVFGGLALITKAPALMAPPLVALLLLALSPAPFLWPRLRQAALVFALWLVAALATAVLAWPAMWASPAGTLGHVVREVLLNGGQPEPAGNFFLGRAVDDPGLLFYPVAGLLRLTPLALFGLLALPLALRRGAPSPPLPVARRGILALLAAVLLYGLALSLEPKKFDRYLLPVFPALDILAALGLIALTAPLAAAARWARRGPGPQGHQGTARSAASLAGVSVIALFVCVTQLALYHPYYLAYYNPLLGGGAVAERTMLVGWGEGMEEVGAWLRGRPDFTQGRVLSWTPPNLAPFLPRAILVRDLRPELLAEGADYAVLYVRSVQRGESPAAEALVRQTPPLFVLERHGITYATVHQLPPPVATPRSASFGPSIALRGFSSSTLDHTLSITPAFSLRGDLPAGTFLFLHLLAPDGQRVAQLDAPLDQGRFAAWQAGQQFAPRLPIPLPQDLAPGTYRLVMGLYDPATGQRLPISDAEALPADLDGPEALLLTTLALPSDP